MHVIWSAKIIHESCGFIMGVSGQSIIIIIIIIIINAKKGVSRFIFFYAKKIKNIFTKRKHYLYTNSSKFILLLNSHASQTLSTLYNASYLTSFIGLLNL